MDIWTACDKGDLERVRQLIQDGQNVNRGNRYGTTPLLLAAYMVVTKWCVSSSELVQM